VELPCGCTAGGAPRVGQPGWACMRDVKKSTPARTLDRAFLRAKTGGSTNEVSSRKGNRRSGAMCGWGCWAYCLLGLQTRLFRRCLRPPGLWHRTTLAGDIYCSRQHTPAGVWTHARLCIASVPGGSWAWWWWASPRCVCRCEGPGVSVVAPLNHGRAHFWRLVRPVCHLPCPPRSRGVSRVSSQRWC